MPFERPSITDIVRRVSADVAPLLPGTDPLLRRSVVGAISRAVAGAAHGLYGYIDWIVRAIFVDTADVAELERHASIRAITRVAPIAAAGTITVTGTAGTAVPAGTVWRRGDGAEYRVSEAAVLPAAGTVEVSVAALVAGQAGNAAAGVKLALVAPLAGVVSDATVASALAGGADAESDASLRARVLDRIRRPPSLGTAADYLQWARAAHPDVTRAWTQANASGLGTVTVRFMTDTATANGIPAGTVVSTVDDYIQARRPVTAAVTVAAPTAVELDVTIDMLEPDTPAVRAAVEAELADLIERDSEPGGTILVSHIREAISEAAGEIDHVLTSPVEDVAHTADQIAVLGDVTWQ